MKQKLPWISVETELPPEMVGVFVAYSRGMYPSAAIGNRFEGRWYVDGYQCHTVTHWMPVTLPEQETK